MNILFTFFTKGSYKEVKRTELSPSVSVPWSYHSSWLASLLGVVWLARKTAFSRLIYLSYSYNVKIKASKSHNTHYWLFLLCCVDLNCFYLTQTDFTLLKIILASLPLGKPNLLMYAYSTRLKSSVYAKMPAKLLNVWLQHRCYDFWSKDNPYKLLVPYSQIFPQ